MGMAILDVIPFCVGSPTLVHTMFINHCSETKTRNSAIADKPPDVFVQMQ